ncbi:MAG: BlaI/MecI/CopY family transcriptional regulator [Oscillospiraceae bacterium]|nr:BlaI/MecI/CopY family transcriptional regulator [Oscillospiraceae bacterium]
MRKKTFTAKKIVKLPDSELNLMMLIWEEYSNGEKKITASMLTERHPETLGELKPTTVLTLLTRLEQKGFIEIDKERRPNYCVPLIQEKEYKQLITEDFVNVVYRKDAKSLVCALIRQNKLAEEDIREIRDMIASEIDADS